MTLAVADRGVMAALAATWPPAAATRDGALTLRDGAGGGSRVSAASLAPGWTGADIDRLVAAMPAPLVRVADDPRLDAALAARGFVRHDPSVIMAGAVAAGPEEDVVRRWPPDGVALWAAQGIGAARLAVMHRAPGPKTVLAAGDMAAAFVACHGGWAVLHALVVAPAARRRGWGRRLTQAAAGFGRDHGAGGLALAVTVANAPARALYAALGLEEVGRYHYRLRPPAARP